MAIFTGKQPERLNYFYWKGTPTQMFFCECWEIFKKTYFEEHLQAAASVCFRRASEVYSLWGNCCNRSSIIAKINSSKYIRGLLRLNLGAWGDLSSKLTWAAAWLLVMRICPAYLVDEFSPCVLWPLMIELMMVLFNVSFGWWVWFYFY